MSEDKPALDRALDLLVYAPIGLALYARDTAPSFLKMFVARGKTEFHDTHRKVGNQLDQAKSVGQMAVSHGAPEVKRQVGEKIDQLRTKAEEILATRDEPQSIDRPAATPASGRVAGKGQVATSVPATTATVTPSVSASALPIPGYDELSASQVVERLVGLSIPELETVRAYEAESRGRRTILGKIEQLTA